MDENQPVRILIADDHEIVRQGIRSLFDLRSEWQICGEAVDGLDAVEKCKSLKPDVVLLDVSMPHLNGLDAARLIRKEVPESKILIVSQHDPVYMLDRALEVGAQGYVAKSELSRHLLAAVEDIVQRKNGTIPQPWTQKKSAQKDPKGTTSFGTQPAKIQAQRESPATTARPKDRQFRIMADTAPVMIWISGTDTFCSYFNRSWLDFTGRTMEQELGNGWAEGVHPEDRQRCIDTYLSAFHSREPYKVEYRLLHAGDQYRWVLTHGVPRYSDEGLFEGYIGSCIDITERRSAEEMRSRLAAIVESSEDAIISKDLNGIITSWNQSAERIFGYSKAEAVGKSIMLIIPPELADEETQIARRLKLGQRIEHVETTRVAKGGRKVRVVLTISPVKDASGKIIGGSKIARDITKAKHVEGALHESEQRARFTLEAASVGTWQWDIATGAVQWSENMESVHGQPRGSFRGNFESFFERVREEDRDKVKKALEEALAGDGKYRAEYRQLREDGTLGWMEAQGQLIRDDAGRPLRMIGICMNISERKKAEENLRLAHENLEQGVRERTAELERAQDRLRALSGRLMRMQDDERRRIARELHDSAGQVLIGLKLNLVPLEEQLAKDPDLLKPVKESLGLVDELSRDLRTISHLLHPPLLDEAGLYSALRWYVEGFSERSKIQVALHLAQHLGRLPADYETAIFRVIQECLTNIHRHSESNTATIRITHDAERITIEIADQGKGMPVPVPRAGVGIQGMGERVRQLGGSLDIESGSAGTRVLATLPVKRVKEETSAEAVRAAS